MQPTHKSHQTLYKHHTNTHQCNLQLIKARTLKPIRQQPKKDLATSTPRCFAMAVIGWRKKEALKSNFHKEEEEQCYR